MLAEAKQQLIAGQVDARLLVAITFLAIKLPVDILDFGNVGPDGDPAIPLRYVDLAESKQAGRAISPAYLRALRASLGAVSADYRPTRIVTAILNGQRVLRIEFLAPTPLGMIAPQTEPPVTADLWPRRIARFSADRVNRRGDLRVSTSEARRKRDAEPRFMPGAG